MMIAIPSASQTCKIHRHGISASNKHVDINLKSYWPLERLDDSVKICCCARSWYEKRVDITTPRQSQIHQFKTLTGW